MELVPAAPTYLYHQLPPSTTNFHPAPPAFHRQAAFKKKFLGPDLYEMLPWDPVKIVEHFTNAYLEEVHHPNISDMLRAQGCGLPGIDIVVVMLVGKASKKLVKKLVRYHPHH